MKYLPRIADQLLQNKLESKGAVLIRGPKWCGKSTTAGQKSKSILDLNDTAALQQNIELSRIDPSLLLHGDTPRLIDEWQEIPSLWDSVRREVDLRRKVGQFILTGSATPLNEETRKQIHHTGTGRFAFVNMYTMSLFESGESSGEVSLGDLFNGPKEIRGINQLNLKDIAYLVCRGGWPFGIDHNLSMKASLEQAIDYVDVVVEEDISRLDGVDRNPDLARKILRSYARNQGGQTPITKIKNDIAANEHSSISEETVSKYINALRQIFVIKDLEAWNPNLRSKTSIRTTPTRYFIDPSLSTASLRIGPDDLINRISDFGFFFESLCIRDLRVYAESIDGDLFHYRDSNGLECDAVVHLRNGKYGLIEIKLGGDKLIEEGIKNLNKLNDILDTTKMESPSFKMILTAVGSYAYRREDGIYIVPIGCLKP
ncbi:MAG: ATP-binding protein [Muribaculaceae bacterium]|nr:ATP-binding protein [Muribaculaceae bacterium]